MCDAFRQISLNVTGPPKAGVRFFCVIGKESWTFSEACRRRSCLPSWMPKQWPKISKTPQRPLAFSLTDTGILGRIGHKVYVQENWRSYISLSLLGQMYLEIHDLIFLQLFFFISFSSPAPLKPQAFLLLNLVALAPDQCHKPDPSHSAQAEADEYTGAAFNPSRCFQFFPALQAL